MIDLSGIEPYECAYLSDLEKRLEPTKNEASPHEAVEFYESFFKRIKSFE